MKPVGFIMTFVAGTTAMVFFRAPTVSSAIDMVRGIVGLNGIALPHALFDKLGPLAATFHRLGVVADSGVNKTSRRPRFGFLPC